ncbi:hypothetical protein LCM16_21090 [Mameliella alba]|nr:hypothetical protein [Mameliella alba]
MAKGDFLEPVLEALFEFTTRIFLPRAGSSSVLDELSWSWFIVLGLVGLAHLSIRSVVSEMDKTLNKEQAGRYRNKLRFGRLALWGVLFLSLFMFRFASAF